MPGNNSLHLRPATNADSAAIISLVDGVYREYGDQIFLDGADSDLLDVEANYAGHGGQMVVLVDDSGQVRGSQAIKPITEREGVCTFRRLFLDPTLRGGGWGEKLMSWAIQQGIERGYQRVEFWSDTRFIRAHQFFKRLGFEHEGQVRKLNDGFMPYEEFFFFGDLSRLAENLDE